MYRRCGILYALLKNLRLNCIVEESEGASGDRKEPNYYEWN